MKTIISVVSTFVCATGVAIVSHYCIKTNHQNTASDQKKAAEVAAKICKCKTIPEYKAKNRHSSAVKQTTTAKVEAVVKEPTYVPNPLYPLFMEALKGLTDDVASMAAEGDVELDNGFVLTLKNGKPFLKFPEAYKKIGIGGIAIGDEINGHFGVSRRKVDGTEDEVVDGIGCSKGRRLDEPEFYCDRVTYSALPATKQVDSIQMHGNLKITNEDNAKKMVKEIDGWMKEDYDAVPVKTDVPADKIALKRYKVGDGMDVEVAVKWDKKQNDSTTDAQIEIKFTTSELVEDNKYERQQLGAATDEARQNVYKSTGVNYYTVNEKVNADNVAKKIVR